MLWEMRLRFLGWNKFILGFECCLVVFVGDDKPYSLLTRSLPSRSNVLLTDVLYALVT